MLVDLSALISGQAGPRRPLLAVALCIREYFRVFGPNKHQMEAETSEIFGRVSLVKRSRALDQAHAAKDFGRLCFHLVFVWAEHPKIFPYAKSDRQ